jgi:hypothetical protein
VRIAVAPSRQQSRDVQGIVLRHGYPEEILTGTVPTPVRILPRYHRAQEARHLG